MIDLYDPEEGQQSDDSPRSLASESPHEIPSSVSMELPLSPPDIVVEESPQNVIPISAIEPPIDHQQESLLEIFEDTPACIHLSKIDTSTSSFEEFMKQTSYPLVTEKTMVAIQIDTSPRMTTVAQTKIASPLLPAATKGELMALTLWLSLFTPKRKK